MMEMSENQLSLHTKSVYKTNSVKHQNSKSFENNISKRVDGVGNFTVKSIRTQKKFRSEEIELYGTRWIKKAV